VGIGWVDRLPEVVRLHEGPRLLLLI
jgi:hypothetical protein